MANVDREIIGTIDEFKNIRRTDNLKIEGKNRFYRFNTKYESVLSTLIPVDYKKCIEFVLSKAEEIDKFVFDKSEAFHDFISIINQKDDKSFGISFLYATLDGEGDSLIDGLIFTVTYPNIKDMHKWMFMCSVIANALNYKFNTTFIIDIYVIHPYIWLNDLNSLSKIEYASKEIPQFTINEDCRGKNVSEMKVDDFEIWNYCYD